MKKCSVCGTKLLPQKESVYKVVEAVTALESLAKSRHVYDAIDCPRCGCQEVLKIRMPLYVEEEKEGLE